MPEILITVRDKIAQLANRSVVVCDSTDYVAVFDFDEEWDAYPTRTAQFNFGGLHVPVVFDGAECPMPQVSEASVLRIGVYAGDLHTTTSALVPCLPSIRSGAGAPADPTDDVYNQIMAKLNDLGEISEEEIAAAVEDYLTAHPVETAQSDWSVNDPSDPAYVKGRTHWEERTEVSIEGLAFTYHVNINDCTDNPDEDEASEFLLTAVVPWTPAVPLALGQVWKVSVRGRQSYNSPGVTVGTMSNGEPALDVADQRPLRIYADRLALNRQWLSNSAIDDITITGVSGTYGGAPAVHPLDPKYIPDSVKPLTVAITYNADTGSYSADKTFAEIKAAYDAGRVVQGDRNGAMFVLNWIAENFAVFDATYSDDGASLQCDTLMMSADGSIRFETVGALPGSTTALPNPNKLTFTGAVEATYDGSSAVTVEIPEGGAGDSSLGITGASVGQTVKITEVDADGRPTAWEAVSVDTEFELLGTMDVSTGDTQELMFDAPMREIAIVTSIVDSAGGQYGAATTDGKRLISFYAKGLSVKTDLAWWPLGGDIGLCAHAWGLVYKIVVECGEQFSHGTMCGGLSRMSDLTALNVRNTNGLQYVVGHVSGVRMTLILNEGVENTATGTVEVYGKRA